MNKQTITIELDYYFELLKDSDFLYCLKAQGVDNWDGYELALEMLEDEEIATESAPIF